MDLLSERQLYCEFLFKWLRKNRVYTYYKFEEIFNKLLLNDEDRELPDINQLIMRVNKLERDLIALSETVDGNDMILSKILGCENLMSDVVLFANDVCLTPDEIHKRLVDISEISRTGLIGVRDVEIWKNISSLHAEINSKVPQSLFNNIQRFTEIEVENVRIMGANFKFQTGYMLVTMYDSLSYMILKEGINEPLIPSWGNKASIFATIVDKAYSIGMGLAYEEGQIELVLFEGDASMTKEGSIIHKKVIYSDDEIDAVHFDAYITACYKSSDGVYLNVEVGKCSYNPETGDVNIGELDIIKSKLKISQNINCNAVSVAGDLLAVDNAAVFPLCPAIDTNLGFERFKNEYLNKKHRFMNLLSSVTYARTIVVNAAYAYECANMRMDYKNANTNNIAQYDQTLSNLKQVVPGLAYKMNEIIHSTVEYGECEVIGDINTINGKDYVTIQSDLVLEMKKTNIIYKPLFNLVFEPFHHVIESNDSMLGKSFKNTTDYGMYDDILFVNAPRSRFAHFEGTYKDKNGVQSKLKIYHGIDFKADRMNDTKWTTIPTNIKYTYEDVTCDEGDTHPVVELIDGHFNDGSEYAKCNIDYNLTNITGWVFIFDEGWLVRPSIWEEKPLQVKVIYDENVETDYDTFIPADMTMVNGIKYYGLLCEKNLINDGDSRTLKFEMIHKANDDGGVINTKTFRKMWGMQYTQDVTKTGELWLGVDVENDDDWCRTSDKQLSINTIVESKWNVSHEYEGMLKFILEGETSTGSVQLSKYISIQLKDSKINVSGGFRSGSKPIPIAGVVNWNAKVVANSNMIQSLYTTTTLLSREVKNVDDRLSAIENTFKKNSDTMHEVAEIIDTLAMPAMAYNMILGTGLQFASQFLRYLDETDVERQNDIESTTSALAWIMIGMAHVHEKRPYSEVDFRRFVKPDLKGEPFYKSFKQWISVDPAEYSEYLTTIRDKVKNNYKELITRISKDPKDPSVSEYEMETINDFAFDRMVESFGNDLGTVTMVTEPYKANKDKLVYKMYEKLLNLGDKYKFAQPLVKFVANKLRSHNTAPEHAYVRVRYTDSIDEPDDEGNTFIFLYDTTIGVGDNIQMFNKLELDDVTTYLRTGYNTGRWTSCYVATVKDGIIQSIKENFENSGMTENDLDEVFNTTVAVSTKANSEARRELLEDYAELENADAKYVFLNAINGRDFKNYTEDKRVYKKALVKNPDVRDWVIDKIHEWKWNYDERNANCQHFAKGIADLLSGGTIPQFMIDNKYMFDSFKDYVYENSDMNKFFISEFNRFFAVGISFR